MFKVILWSLGAGVAFSSLSWGCDAGAEKGVPIIFAAASLSDALKEIEERYSESGGTEVAFSFAGSTLLANQIVAGAPADAIVAAGSTPIRILVDAGHGNEARVKRILANELVLVAEEDSTESGVTAIQDIVGSGVLAIPNPDAAPAGEYAFAALQNEGVWTQLQGQIVPTLDVRAALGAVTSGNADWAVVYASDADSNAQVSVVYRFKAESPDSQPSYYALPIGESEPVSDFLDYLNSDSAQAIFEKHGFKATLDK